MSQRTARLLLIFIVLLIVSIISVTLVAYNLGYSNGTTAASLSNRNVQAKVLTATLELAPDLVVSTLQGQLTSPLILEAKIAIPAQEGIKDETGDRLRFALFSGGLALAASLLMGLLGYAYNYFSSRESRQFEWAKYVWGKYEQDYLEFARVIRSTLDPNILRKALDKLEETAFVPSQIRRRIETYIEQLRNEENAEEKVAKRESLLLEYGAFLRSPWRDI